jgi:hypothetical protein
VAIKGFSRWLSRQRPLRWPIDPLADLSPLNADADL